MNHKPSIPISFVDTTLRDGHLSLWASNMRTGMMLPIAERLDRAGFEGIEIMSSAFYKKCVRDLKDDPWRRVRLLRQRIRNTPLRSIRSRSMLAFQITPPSITDLWLERLAANGIDELRTALANHQIEPWFQPQVEFANGKVVAVEALARWRRAGQVLRPAHFLALLEREGLAQALTDTMLEQACRWKRYWDDRGLRLNISVNVSTMTLADPAVADHYQQIVQDLGVDPTDVMLEITESSLMADAARGLSVLARLRLKGFGLSIDDFGTGYSSLSQLKRFPIDALKIDRSFIRGIPTDKDDMAITEAILALGKTLGVTIVAEGVETDAQQAFLKRHACHEMQGFYFSRPIPPDEFAQFYQAHVASHAV